MTLRFDVARRTVAGLAVTVAALGLLAQTARADTLSVFADLPVAMDLKLDNQKGQTDSMSASGLSGYVVGLTLPIFVGLAYESYGSKFNSSNVIGGSFRYDVTMYDLFLNLPLPVVNIAAGLGTGTGSVSSPPAGVSVKDATLTQWFASLGIPVLPLVDVHLAYHSFSGTNAISTPAGQPDLKTNGTMWSLGVKVGF